MSDPIEQPKRGRGRPRLPAEEKKRRNMTFRVRDELRDAVEELAQAKGRSISEQIEYYVEAGVSEEIRLVYEYSYDGMSEALRKCSVGSPRTGLRVKLSSNSSIVKTSLGQSLSDLNNNLKPEINIDKSSNANDLTKIKLPLSWAQDPAEREGALHMARAMLDGIVRGALESFEELLGPDVVAALQADGAIGLSSINIKTNRAFHEMEDRSTKAEAEVERLRAEIEAFKVRAPGVMPPSGESEIDPLSIELIEAEFARLLGRPLPKQDGTQRTLTWAEIGKLRNMFGTAVHEPEALTAPSVVARPQVRFSTAALRDLVARFMDSEPDLEALRATGWPVRFGELSTGTRTALIGELREGAPDVYQTLMSSTAPRHEAITALRRLQGVLLPRVNEDEGADEDIGIVGKRGDRARR